MPKLKKRRNVPNQRKQKKKAKLLCVNSDVNLDHTYTINRAFAAECVNKEIEMLEDTENSIHIDGPDIVFFQSEETVITEPDPYDTLRTTIWEQLPESFTFNTASEIIQNEQNVITEPDPYDTLRTTIWEQLPEPFTFHAASEIIKNEENVITEPDPYDILRTTIREQLPEPFIFNMASEIIQIFQLYPASDKLSVKLNITIDRDFIAKIYVHRIKLPTDHYMWFGLPAVYDSVKTIQTLLSKLENFTVCVGNYDSDIIDSIPVGSALKQTNSSSPHIHGYREGDFGAVKGTISYTSTVRSINCSLLVEGNRCYCCSKLRKYLVNRKYRQEEKKRKENDSPLPNFLHSRIKHKDMTREQLITKINQQKNTISCLQSEISKTKRTFQHELIVSPAVSRVDT